MRILLALLAGAGLGVAPRPAAACSCVDGSLVQLPAHDARDVPLNARVFAGDGVLPYEEVQPPPEHAPDPGHHRRGGSDHRSLLPGRPQARRRWPAPSV